MTINALRGSQLSGAGYQVRVGTVTTTAAGGRVTVRVDEVNVSLHVLRNYSPTIGDQCLVALRRGQGYVIGALGTAPTGVPDTDPTDPSVPNDPPAGSTIFRPVQADTWREGTGWLGISEVAQGDPNGRGAQFGGAFYGSGPRGLRGVTPTAIYWTVTRLPGGAPLRGFTMQLLPSKTKPVTKPVPLASQASGGSGMAAGERRSWALPLAWATDFLAGTAGGVGMHDAVTNNESTWFRAQGSTATLRIDWKR